MERGVQKTLGKDKSRQRRILGAAASIEELPGNTYNWGVKEECF